MAHARSLKTSTRDSEARGAAKAAPLLNPLRLAETAVAAIADLMRESAGADFSGGAIAIGAIVPVDHAFIADRRAAGTGLLADANAERLLYVVPLDGDAGTSRSEELVDYLTAAGLDPIASAPRQSKAAVEDALREAGILVELLADPKATLRAHEPTYRLLISVLLREPEEVLRLRTSTIAPIEQYDSAHDTDLLCTLETFLGHHGSTTDTAEAMKLHRHTVGYRLARVQEVSGLSPYESDGRERLSLGLKAQRILLAEDRRVSPSRS